MNKNNILLVGPYPPPFGGVSSHLYELNKSFKNTDYNFHVLQFDSYTENSIDGNLKIYKRTTAFKVNFLLTLVMRLDKSIIALSLLFINFFKSPRLYVSSFIKALQVIELIDKNNINRVVVYTTKIGALIPFVKIFRPKLEVFYCIYADPYKNPHFYKKHRYWYKKAVEQSKKVFSSSCYCADAYGNFTKSVNPEVIYVGVDLDRFHEMDPVYARAKLRIPERPTVLFLGRMEPEMGADNALEIAKIILSKDININFIIAGAKGSLTDSISKSVSTFENRLIVKSNLSQEEIPYYYGASTISIAPTLGLHACMGVSIKEAMASGRPTIATDSGGIPEAIRNDIDGFIVPLNEGKIDNQSFSEKVLSLLKDEEKINLFSKNSRQRCEEIFSVNATAEKYLKLFEES